MLSYFDTEEQTPDQVRLYETCLKGSREEIRNYCRNGDIASQYIKDGMNPMHVVAIAGRKDAEVILDMMLQNGFDVNAQTMSGDDTVLHLIVEHIDVKEAFPLVLKILEYNPDLQIRNRRLRTPYDIAVAREEYELAEVLDGHMSAAEAREYYRNKIAAIYGAKLIDAVLRSNETDIQDFLKLGADPNYVNEHKNGAIHYAITHCTLPPQRTLQLLIDGKADVNLQDDEGDTALNLVIKMTKLKDSGEMYKCAELLVQNGALSTYKDLDGNDALSLAKKRQYDDIVKLLTERRPQHVQFPPLVDDDDDGPLPPLPEAQTEETDTAEPRRQPRLSTPTERVIDSLPPPPQVRPPVRPQIPPATRFLPPPPDLDDISDDGEDIPPPSMPQHIMNDFLTPRGRGGGGVWPPNSPVSSDPALYNNQDWDTLVRAIREGTLEEVNEALFGLRADPNVPGDDGIYPIHHVLIRGEMDEDERLEMLRSLIEAGVDVNQKTVNSESTPLHVAATRNQDEAAKVLLGTHKCDYNLKNKHDKTPYDVAEEEECQEVMDVIENHRRAVRQRMQRAAKASTCLIL